LAGKTDLIPPIGDRESVREGQAESPERAGVAVRHGSVFPHWSQTNLCTRLRAPGERNIVSSARSIWPLVYRVVPNLSTANLRRHDAHTVIDAEKLADFASDEVVSSVTHGGTSL